MSLRRSALSALRLVLANVVLLVALLATCAGVGEVVLRAAPARNDHVVRHGETKYRFNPYQPDADLGWTHRPHWETVHETDEFSVRVRTGALGLRAGPETLARGEGVYRILVLGDSFAFGWGVGDGESFAARLEALLPPPPGFRAVQVLNAGVAGWSGDHYRVYASRHLAELAPDLVLLAPSENDLSDLAWNRLTLDARRLPVRTTSTLRMIDRTGRMRYLDGGPMALPALRFPGQLWLAEHSALYHELRYRLARVWLGWSHERAMAMHEREYGGAPERPIAELTPAEVERGLLGDRDFQRRYHEYLLDAIREAARARGIAVRTLLVEKLGEAPERDSTIGALRADCRADPGCVESSALLAELPADRAFYPKDGHFTREGHAAVAEGLAAFLGASRSDEAALSGPRTSDRAARGRP